MGCGDFLILESEVTGWCLDLFHERTLWCDLLLALSEAVEALGKFVGMAIISVLVVFVLHVGALVVRSVVEL